MDDTSNSVYLAGPGQSTWEAWTEKTSNGGSCSGKSLGYFKHLACNNLANTFSSRIAYVSYVPSTWVILRAAPSKETRPLVQRCSSLLLSVFWSQSAGDYWFWVCTSTWNSTVLEASVAYDILGVGELDRGICVLGMDVLKTFQLPCLFNISFCLLEFYIHSCVYWYWHCNQSGPQHSSQKFELLFSKLFHQ